MRRAALALLLGLPALAAAASPASAACADALALLREREDQLIAAPAGGAGPARQRMLQARRAAAQTCLGESGGERPAPSTRTEAPAVRAPHGKAPAPIRAVPVQPAPPTPGAARTLASCDANGCWTSDGQRLQRVGSQLLGPGGVCSTAGLVVQCP